jgi:cytoskeletal protein CcmA (bactofilin family)
MNILNVFDQNRSESAETQSEFNKDQKNKASGSPPRKLTDTIKTFMLIDQEAKVSGKINTSGDVVIEGDFEGDIIARNLTINTTGRVSGKVVVQTAIIDGELSPEINCSGLLTIKPNGRLHGKITYNDLIVELGGKCFGEMLEHQSGVITSLMDVKIK